MKKIPPVNKFGFINLSGDYSVFPDNGFKHTNLSALARYIHCKYIFIQDKFDEICCIHKKISDYFSETKDSLGTVVNISYEQMNNNKEKYIKIGYSDKYIFEIESLIAHIRHCFDYLVQVLSKHLEGNKNDLKVHTDSIGRIKEKSNIWDVIYGSEIYEKDCTGFIDLINNISNSIKHHHRTYESINYYHSTPGVMVFYLKNGEFDTQNIKSYSLCLYQIMLGFQNNFNRILENISNCLNLKENRTS